LYLVDTRAAKRVKDQRSLDLGGSRISLTTRSQNSTSRSTAPSPRRSTKSAGTVVGPEDSCRFLGHRDVVSIEVSGNDRLRRVSLVVVRPTEDLLAEPTAATQGLRRQPLLRPSRHSRRTRCAAVLVERGP